MAMDAALAMEAAPKQATMAVADTRVLMPFIVVFPHMYGDSFRRGNGLERDDTENSDRASLSSQIFNSIKV